MAAQVAGPAEADTPPQPTQAIAELVGATTEAVERVLAAPPGSIRLAGPGSLDTWFGPAARPAARQ